MTRDEIEKISAVEPYCFETDREEIWYEIGCIDGLKAADAEPNLKSLWHNASEKPTAEPTSILATDEKGFTEVYHLEKGRKLRIQNSCITWSSIVFYYKLTKWAYISDLLPKGGEK